MSNHAGSYVVWINGPFGVGKTTTAQALAVAIGGEVFDPEVVGLQVRRTIPSAARPSDDFQDLPQWREQTRRTIADLIATTSRPVVVPMTLVNEQYFDEIVGGLRLTGITVHHVTLMASRETIRRRLLRRWCWPWATRWALGQLDRCLAGLQCPTFAPVIDTDGVPVKDVVQRIRRMTEETEETEETG